MKPGRKIITAADMDKMTAQERADAIDASTIRSWDDVDPSFRDAILAEGRRLNAELRRRNG